MDVHISKETMEERELVGMARKGDQDAFGKLFLAHHGAIFRLARATLGDGAEDVASETFVRAWTALPKYQGDWGTLRHMALRDRTPCRRRRASAPVPFRTPGRHRHGPGRALS